MYRSVSRCRACGSKRLLPVFDLGVQPLANDFCFQDDDRAGYAPLQVLFCEGCTLGQLSVVVDPQMLYRHYNYITSDSRSMEEHFGNLVDDIEKENGRGSVLEIGSNDGRLLAYFKKRGFGPVLGIDPAENLQVLAMERGIDSISKLFTRDSATQAKEILKKVDVIIARHVFCHVDDWTEFLHACESICHPGTLIALEVPYVKDLLDQAEFDTIYHEHTSYLSIRAIQEALHGTKLTLQRVFRYSVHGGAILLLIRKGDAPANGPADDLPITSDDWFSFALKSGNKIKQLSQTVRDLVLGGKVIAGYGASAKSTVWINACQFTELDIRFITDNTPQKIGKFSPGSKIPIVDEKELLNLMPDYCVMFCWNFRTDVINKNQNYLKAGGHFIVPSPVLEIV